MRHGLRTLVKRGDSGALALLGYASKDIVIEDFRVLTPVVSYPGALQFTAVVRNQGSEPARVSINYIVHHLRANGSQSQKTFRLTMRALAPGEEVALSRSHEFRPITTSATTAGNTRSRCGSINKRQRLCRLSSRA